MRVVSDVIENAIRAVGSSLIPCSKWGQKMLKLERSFSFGLAGFKRAMNRNVELRNGTSNLLQNFRGRDARGDEDCIAENSCSKCHSKLAGDSLPTVAMPSPASRNLPSRRNAQVGLSPIRDAPSKPMRSDGSSASLDSGIGGDSSKRPSLENDCDKLAMMSIQESSRKLSQYANEMSTYPLDSCLLENQILKNEAEDEKTDSSAPAASSPKHKVSVSKEAFEDLVKSVVKLLDEQNKGETSYASVDGNTIKSPVHHDIGTEHKPIPMTKLSSPSLCESRTVLGDEESKNSSHFRKLSTSFRQVSSGRLSTEKGPCSTVLVKTSMTRKIQERKRFSEILGVFKPSDIPYTEIVVPNFYQWNGSAKDLPEGSMVKSTTSTRHRNVDAMRHSPSSTSFQSSNMLSSTPVSTNHTHRPHSPLLKSCECSSPTALSISDIQEHVPSLHSIGDETPSRTQLKTPSSTEDSLSSSFASTPTFLSPPVISVSAPATSCIPTLTSECENSSSFHCHQTSLPLLPRSLGEVVDQNMPQFVQLTDWTSLYSYLISRNLLNSYMREYINNAQISNQHKGNKFYGEYMAKMGKEGYARLVECFRDETEHLGHKELLKIMEKYLQAAEK